LKLLPILFTGFLFILPSHAGFFSMDHKLTKDKKCTIKLGGRYNHQVVCAVHTNKRKQNLTFCQGDIVKFKNTSDPVQVFTIRGSLAYGKGIRFKKSVKNSTDHAQKVTKKSCDQRKAWIKKNEMTVIRAYYNKNYTGR